LQSKQQAASSKQPEAGSWQPVASSMKQNSIFPYLRLSKINLFMNYLRQLILVPILLLLNYSSFAQWTPLTTGTNDNISCVRYASSGQVWAGTWNGVLRSSNSGVTFNFVSGLNSTLGNSQIIGSFDDLYVTGPSSAVGIGFFLSRQRLNRLRNF
jgi:hypothetical protein